jgi:hypothetical protein
MIWPWRRFEEFFEAFARRSAIDRVHGVKEAMISGVWANSNYDEENIRADLLRKIDQFVGQAIFAIYGEGDEEELDMSDPFLSAMKVPEVPKIDHGLDRDQVGEVP